MNKFIDFLFTVAVSCSVSIGVSIFLSMFDKSGSLGSDTELDIIGQLFIFLVFSLIFKFQKRSYKKILYWWATLTVIMLLSDILIFGLPNVRWEITIKMLSIWIAPFIGILYLKKLGDIYKKAIESGEKEK